MNEEAERLRINSIRSGNHRDVVQGSNRYVEDWISGKKHDPDNDINIRIRAFIRATPNTTKGDIIIHFRRQEFTRKQITGNLRELHKMGLFNASS